MKLFLIGYMGAGKTTLGKLLAKKLNLQFIDVDLFIENRYHRSVSTLFKEKGEDGFRAIERRVLQEIIGFENTVISTGGGLPCFCDNMQLMNQMGTTIYLKATVETLLKRLIPTRQKRPLIQGKNPKELKDFIEMSLEKREVFYNDALHVFHVDEFLSSKDMDKEVDQLVLQIS